MTNKLKVLLNKRKLQKEDYKFTPIIEDIEIFLVYYNSNTGTRVVSLINYEDWDNTQKDEILNTLSGLGFKYNELNNTIYISGNKNSWDKLQSYISSIITYENNYRNYFYSKLFNVVYTANDTTNTDYDLYYFTKEINQCYAFIPIDILGTLLSLCDNSHYDIRKAETRNMFYINTTYQILMYIKEILHNKKDIDIDIVCHKNNIINTTDNKEVYDNIDEIIN